MRRKHSLSTLDAAASAAIVIPLPFTPRDGRGSMVTAAAITLFDLVAGEG